MAIEEVRIVTAIGTAHRAFEDEHGVLFTAEGCNLERGEAADGREIVRRSSPGWNDTRRACERCLR